MVLGDPVAVVAEAVGQARQLERVAQRLRAGEALGDRGLVEDGEAEDEAMLGGARPRLPGYPGPVRRMVLVLLGCFAIACALAAVSSGHATARHAQTGHARATAIPRSLLELIERKTHPSATPRPECSFATGACGCTVPVAVAVRPHVPSTPGGECPASKSSPCMEYVAGAETIRTAGAPLVASCKPRQFWQDLRRNPPANKPRPRH